MFVCFFLMTTDKSDDLLPLMLDNFRAMGSRMRIHRPTGTGASSQPDTSADSPK